MTGDQIAAIAETSINMLQAPSAPAASSAPAAPNFADDEYLTGAQFRAAMATATQPDPAVAQMVADANLAIVRNQNASEFAKYGGEINALIARMPANQRTIDNLQLAVKMIRSDHVDEIAAERAQQLAATMTSTMRPTGGAPSAPVSPDASLESEKIPAEWKERARAAKITNNVVADFCRANGMTPLQFYKQFDTPMNNIVGEHGKTSR